MEELSVVGGRSERGLERLTAQKVQYQINASGPGHRIQLYIELVVCIHEYVRARQLFLTVRVRLISNRTILDNLPPEICRTVDLLVVWIRRPRRSRTFQLSWSRSRLGRRDAARR